MGTKKVNIAIEFLHIGISLGPKFQLKLIILIFWTKTGISSQKRLKVNVTIKFCIFELV